MVIHYCRSGQYLFPYMNLLIYVGFLLANEVLRRTFYVLSFVQSATSATSLNGGITFIFSVTARFAGRPHRGSATHFRPWPLGCPSSNHLNPSIATFNFRFRGVMRCVRKQNLSSVFGVSLLNYIVIIERHNLLNSLVYSCFLSLAFFLHREADSALMKSTFARFSRNVTLMYVDELVYFIVAPNVGTGNIEIPNYLRRAVVFIKKIHCYKLIIFLASVLISFDHS